MSLSNVKALARVAVAAVLTLGLAACFRPLYGPTATGEPLEARLAAIEVAPITAIAPTYERLGHYLRSELVFDLNGSGEPAPKRYKLTLSFAGRVQSTVVDRVTGRAQAATQIGDVTYTLTTLDEKTVITQGRATGFASYDRSVQRFATVRAAQDAEIRLAKSLSDQIRTRIAATLASRS